jgi:hypothetical protein
MTKDKLPPEDSQDEMPPHVKKTLIFKIVAILAFTLIFVILRVLGVIDELPLKMGVLERFFK